MYGLTLAPLGRQEHVAVIVFCGTADSGGSDPGENCIFGAPPPPASSGIRATNFLHKICIDLQKLVIALPGIRGMGKRLFLIV